tara:strand:+ start:267 stop:515 length:249 start_codon:yes stop_codon:yes gene_type:complete
MSTLSYLNYDDIGVFGGLYQQYQQAPDSVDQGWRNFIEGFEFSKADFSQGNKKSRMPQAHPTFAEAIKVSMLDATGKCFFHM